jgi:tetratricopeptide (TPR) repeat protein
MSAAAEVALLLGDPSIARSQAQAVLVLVEQSPKASRSLLRPNQRTARSVLSWVYIHAGDNAAAAAIAETEDPLPTHKYNRRADFVELKTPRALALARLGRREESRALIEPAVAFLRAALADQPGHCASLEELAWAIFVEAAAQPPGANDRRQALLSEARTLVNAMTDDYRALRPVQELSDWIASAQVNAGGPNNFKPAVEQVW